MNIPVRFALPIASLLVLLGGCSRGDGLTAISGTVTYDKQPVRSGTIDFVPADGKGPTAAAVITDGKYSVKAAPGPKSVSIEGVKVIGKRPLNREPNAPMVEIQERIVPDKYNTMTTLTCEIKPNVNTYDFALEK